MLPGLTVIKIILFYNLLSKVIVDTLSSSKIRTNIMHINNSYERIRMLIFFSIVTIIRINFLTVGFPSGSRKNPPVMQETQKVVVQSLHQKILWKRKWKPSSIFFLGKTYTNRGAWWAIVSGIAKSLT